jgi:glycine cleavage system aminomethyltransferase T
MVLEGDRVPAHGDAITAEDKEVGRVTSAVRSIALGKPIALGYIRREYFAAGSAVTIVTGEGPVPARVAELPFVRAA